MSSDKEAFEERLRRISQSREQAFAPVGAGSGRMPPKGAKSNHKTMWALGIVVFGLVCAGGVTLVAAKISAGPNALMRETLASLQGADVLPAEPGFLERVALMIFPDETTTSDAPISFLPAAPDGWVRVTTADAALPDALDAIKARWPQGADVLPIEQNLGFKQLTEYLEVRAEQDLESKVLSKLRTTAIYLNGNGEFLSVQLEFEPKRNPLGGQNDPASWIEGLAAIEEKSLGIGEILERLTLAGIDVTNQTKAAGTSLVRRPIGSDIYAQTAMKIAVPLTSRAILRLHGLATPVVAQALIAGVDRDDLSARLE